MTHSPTETVRAESGRREANRVRLTNRQSRLAINIQRQGKTLSEIAAFLGVPVSVVTQTLYWDRVRDV